MENPTWISGPESQIVKYDDVGVYNPYTFTKDYAFAIKPYTLVPDAMAEYQTTSDSLYIRSDFTIEENSALKKLIDRGIIKPTQTVGISVPLQTQPPANAKRKGKGKSLSFESVNYTEYQFFRPLQDKRPYIGSDPLKGNPGTPDYGSENINENDCLKFAETLTYVTTHGAAENAVSKVKELLEANSNPGFLQTAEPIGKEGQSKQKIPFSDRPNMPPKPDATGNKDADLAQQTKYDETVSKLLDTYNSELAGLVKKVKSANNNKAVPSSGQSYAIVRDKVRNNTAYHVAFVVYRHGNVNITLEAEADNGDGYTPKFCFYDIPSDPTHRSMGNTFHRRWSAELYGESTERRKFLYNNGTTIVLESRDGIQDLIDPPATVFASSMLKKSRKIKPCAGVNTCQLHTPKIPKASTSTKRKSLDPPTLTSKDDSNTNTSRPLTRRRSSLFGGVTYIKNTKTRNKYKNSRNKKSRTKTRGL